MKPLELHIEGFMAFREAVEIDFRPMQLFVLSGPTGAGKSSILDAICFALYGETPRLGVRDLKKILHQDAENPKPQAYVAFAFQHYSHRYRVTRQLSLTKHQVELEIDAEGSWEPYFTGNVQEFRKKLPELLGLDFEAFKKVIMLPQGGFDQFLKQDSPSERRKFLMSLARLDVYDRIREAADLERRALREEIAALEGEERGIAALEPEALQAREQAFQALEVEMQQSQEKDRQARTQLQQMEQRWSWQQERGEAQAQLKLLSDREPEIQELQAQLEQGRALVHRRSELQRLDTLQKHSLELQQSLRQLQQQQEMQDKSAQRLQDERQKLESEEQKLPEIRSEIEALQSLKPQLEALTRIREKQQDAHRQAQALNQQAQELQARKQSLEAQFKTQEKRLGELQAELPAPDLERLELLQELGPELKQHQEHDAQALKTLKGRLSDMRDDLRRKKSDVLQLRKEIQAARQAQAQAEEELLQGQEAWDKAKLLDEAAHLRSHLRPGQDCPVCLQRVQTLPSQDSGHNLQALKRAQEKRQQEFEVARRQTQQREQEEATLRAVYDNRLTQLRDLQQEEQQREAAFATEAQRLRQLLELSDGAELPPVKAIRKEFMALREQQKKRQQTQELRLKLEREREQSRSEIKLNQQECSHLQAQQKRLQQSLDEWQADAQRYEDMAQSHLKLAPSEQESPQSNYLQALLGREKALKDSIERLSQERKKFDASQQDWNALQIQLDAQRQQQQQELDRVSQELADLQDDLRAPLQTLGYATPKEALAALPELETLKRWEEKIQTHQHALIRLQSEIERLEKQLQDSNEISAEALQAQRESSAELQARAERLHNEWRSEKDFLALQAQKRKQSYELITQRLAKTKALERYERIHDDLGQRNLPDFLAKRIMERVIHGASRELMRLSQERYAFFVDENEELVILDHSNCGAPRSVKTLSGGESFLASLALALALHDYLSAGVQLDSLFIDEGFGTLDSEALEQAASVIEQLQRSGKCIGVITHIQELAERFEYQIRVTPSERGSSVELR